MFMEELKKEFTHSKEQNKELVLLVFVMRLF